MGNTSSTPRPPPPPPITATTIPTTTSTKTNDSTTNTNKTPSAVTKSKAPIAPPDKSAECVTELEGVISTATAASTSSPVSTLLSAKKDLDKQFSQQADNNASDNSTELHGLLINVIHAYYDNNLLVFSAEYLSELSSRYGRVAGHNVRLVKAANYILSDIQCSIDDGTPAPINIQQKIRKRGNAASVDLPRADMESMHTSLAQTADQHIKDTYKIQDLGEQLRGLEWIDRSTRGAREYLSDQLDYVNSRAEDLQNQLSRERGSNRQFMAQAKDSIRTLENHIEGDNAIQNNDMNILEAKLEARENRIGELEGELHDIINTNAYAQVTALETVVAEKEREITAVRNELSARETSSQETLHDLRNSLDSARSRGNTLMAEADHLRTELATLQAKLSSNSLIETRRDELIDENIRLESSKVIAENQREALKEQVKTLILASLAHDHTTESLLQGHLEEMEALRTEHAEESAKQTERAAESEVKKVKAAIAAEKVKAVAWMNDLLARAKQWKGKTIKNISEERVVFRKEYVRECEELDVMIREERAELAKKRARVEEERVALAKERTRLEEDRIELAKERTRLEEAAEAAAETKRTGSSDDEAPAMTAMSNRDETPNTDSESDAITFAADDDDDDIVDVDVEEVSQTTNNEGSDDAAPPIAGMRAMSNRDETPNTDSESDAITFAAHDGADANEDEGGAMVPEDSQFPAGTDGIDAFTASMSFANSASECCLGRMCEHSTNELDANNDSGINMVYSANHISKSAPSCEGSDGCELRACCVMVHDDQAVCLDCLVEICGVKNGLMPLFRIMDNELRDAIIQNCTSLEGKELDELIPPSLLCQHKMCRSLILDRLREDCQNDYLECVGCDALVCKFCFDYQDGCLDEAILNARKTDDAAAVTSTVVGTTTLVWSKLHERYSHVSFMPKKSPRPSVSYYVGQVKTPSYRTAVYSTAVEAFMQLLAHFYIKEWALPAEALNSLSQFVTRLIDEIRIALSSPEKSFRNRVDGKSIGDSLSKLASNVQLHINGSKYNVAETTRATNVVNSLNKFADLLIEYDITTLEDYESEAFQSVLHEQGGDAFPWNGHNGIDRLISTNIEEPAPINKTKIDIREANTVYFHMFSQKTPTTQGGERYDIDECFVIRGNTDFLITVARKRNLCYHTCKCILMGWLENDIRLQRLLEQDVVQQAIRDNEEDLDTLDNLSLDGKRSRLLNALIGGMVEDSDLMLVVLQYTRDYICEGEHTPYQCTEEHGKHFSDDEIAKVERKIVNKVRDDRDRILAQLESVEDQAQRNKEILCRQEKHLTFFLDQGLFELIDNNLLRQVADNTHAEFVTKLLEYIAEAVVEFPETLSHLKDIRFDQLSNITAEGWLNDEVRQSELIKLTRSIPSILENQCFVGPELCPRRVLDYNPIEMGAIEGHHLVPRDDKTPRPYHYIRINGAVQYIGHAIKGEVVPACRYHHPLGEEKATHEKAIEKQIRAVTNVMSVDNIPTYSPLNLLSLSATTTDEELIQMQDKMVMFNTELYLRGGYSQLVDGCDTNDLRVLLDAYFGEVLSQSIIFDDLTTSHNSVVNASMGSRGNNGIYVDIFGTSVMKNEQTIKILTGLLKNLSGQSANKESRQIDKNSTNISPIEQAGLIADHFGTKKKCIGSARSLVNFMNEVILTQFVDCFSDTMNTKNQQEEARKQGRLGPGREGTWAGILPEQDFTY